jgi:hypothetical protein
LAAAFFGSVLARWEALITRLTSRRSGAVNSGQRLRMRSMIIAALAASVSMAIGGPRYVRRG